MSSGNGDSAQLQRALQALQQMRSRLDAFELARAEPIAIVGMSCRFPGGANDSDRYWRLLSSGGDAITEVPADRWNQGALFDPDPETRGSTNTRWGGFIEDVDRFDPSFFGIAPREASEMDPQQRLMLEVAWEALEEAGETKQRLSGSRTGVFVGVHSHSSDYSSLQMSELMDIGTYTSTGTAHSLLANRLSYWLDLRGPSLAVDTACSSSLVAAHLAVRSLRSGECDLSLVGGVNLLLTPEVTVALSRMRMMAADGRCKTFDSRADGFVRSEGCGAVVLKRLSDARAAGDTIVALIAGTAINQDGATNGLTAPSGLSQREVIRAALADGRVDPAGVTFVETHGTGTALGDPIEVEALADVLGRAGQAPCLLGAVKTNIGHLEGAAGIAGLIKVALALRNEAIPPNIHFREANPHLGLSGTRLALPGTLQSWPAGSNRHAGVSSFGFGGTNAHVILREAPRDDRESTRSFEAARVQLLPVTAHSPAALDASSRQLADWLKQSPDSLADVCYTAGARRTHHEHRLAVVARTSEEAVAGLMSHVNGEELQRTSHGRADPDQRRRLVFVFSGQGSQWAGMGQELLVEEPSFRLKLQQCEEIFLPIAGWSILDAIAAEEGRSRLKETEIIQPALFAVQVALAEVWRSWGIVADAVVGHSMGEVAAAHVAGAIDLEQAIRIIYHRGRVMRAVEGAGGMASVGLGGAETEKLIAGLSGRVSLAAVNAPSSSVISGDLDAVQEVVAQLEERGVFARILPVALASHSPQMEPLRPTLVDALAQYRSREPELALYSTVTGERVRAGDLDGEYWGRNLRDPVLFSRALSTAVDGDADVLEIGPHPILSTPIRLCIGDDRGLVLGSLEQRSPERQAMLAAAGALFTRGHELAWAALHPNPGKLVSLPRYPWQRQRFWVTSSRGAVTSTSSSASTAAPENRSAPFSGRVFTSPALEGGVFEARLSRSSFAELGEHSVDGQAVAPAAALLQLVHTAANEVLRRTICSVSSVAFHQPLFLPEGDGRVVQVLLNTPGLSAVPFEIHSRLERDLSGWGLHATGTLDLTPGEDRTVRPSEDVEQLLRNSSEQQHTAISHDARSVVAMDAAVIVEPVRHSSADMLARVQMPPDSAGSSGDLRVPLAMDACLRALVSCAGTSTGDARPMIVAAIDRMRLSSIVPSEMICHATLRPGEHRRGTALEGDVVLFDRAGEEVCAFEGVRCVEMPAGVEGGAADRFGRWVHDVEWRHSAVPEGDAGSGVTPLIYASWLILSYDDDAARELGAGVRERGGECRLILDASATSQLSPAELRIELSDPSSVSAAVRSWRATFSGSGGVVFIDGPVVPEGADLDEMQLRIRDRCLTFAAMALALSENDGDDSRLWLVTHSAQPVDVEDVDPVGAALWGFARSVALECADVWGGMIDNSGGDDSAVGLSQVLDHIADSGGEDQAAFRGVERYVPRLVSRAEAPAEPPRIRPGATYLITGGMGVLGLTLARWLATRGATHIVLLGRTALPKREDWNSLPAASRAGRTANEILDLERLGASVVVVAADVADERAMSTLFTRFGADLPPLAGVFHAAGTMPLTSLRRMSAEELTTVLRPKVSGAWLLHRLTTHVKLDHFVLFSSVAALWGSRGLAHYAAANHFLDALAHCRTMRGLPALSVNWGGWKAGDGTREAERLLAASDLRLMDPEVALTHLGGAMSGTYTQVAIADLDWRALQASYDPCGRRPFLREIVAPIAAGVSSVSAASPEVTELGERIKRMPPEDARALLESHVREQVAVVLGVDAAQLLAPRQGFFRLGMDSLMTVELRGRLKRSVGLRLPTTIAFEHPTVEALAAFLATKLIAEDIPRVTPIAHQVVQEERGVGHESLADLGEDELAVMLDGAIAELLSE